MAVLIALYPAHQANTKLIISTPATYATPTATLAT